MNTDTSNSDWKALYRIGGIAPLITVAFYLTQLLVILLSRVTYPTTPESWFALFQRSLLLGLIFLNALDVFSIAFLGLMFLALYVALRKSNPSLMLVAAFFSFLGIAVFVSARAEMVNATISLSNQYADAISEAQRLQLQAAGQAIMSITRATPETIGFLFIAIAGLITSVVILHSGIFGKLTAIVGILASMVTFANDIFVVMAPSVTGVLLPINGLLWLIWWLLISAGLLKLSRGNSKQPI